MTDMEGDSPMACPKCSSPWGTIEGNKLICKCGYEHTIPLKPSYEALERENSELRQRLANILKDVNVNPPETH